MIMMDVPLGVERLLAAGALSAGCGFREYVMLVLMDHARVVAEREKDAELQNVRLEALERRYR